MNESRKNLYSFLASIYEKEVTSEFLNSLLKRKELFFSVANTLRLQCPEMAEGFKCLGEYVQGLGGSDLKRVQLKLAVDYAGLFLGVWRIILHPSESVYVTDEHLLMQKPRDEVLEKYEMMGLEKASDFPEPEDHIALELAFMAYICEKTNVALRNSDYVELKKVLEIQRDFLNQHLDKWVPILADDVIKGARENFYKAIAKITKAFIKLDKKLVSELCECSCAL